MALKDCTYSDLANAMADWMARSDLTVAQNRDCIYMFEAEVNRRLSDRRMETTTALTTSSGAATLPTDYMAWRGLTWSGASSQEVEYVHPTVFRASFTTTEVGIPQWFTIEGTTINIRPCDDTASRFSLRYWQKVPNLSEASPTNWLLTAHPDFYLHGCLYEAYKFVRDADAAGTAKQLMEEGFQQLYELNERSKAPAELRIIGTVV